MNTNRKKVAIGVAAGVLALAGVATLLKRRKDKKRAYKETVEDAKQHMKGKLNELQRKAQKDMKNAENETESAVNTAKEKANNWVNKTASA
ncbi:hypothetical protein GCM10007424_12320 [Flavobacterium suaedae]|uniref:YtxH domain-containing protein n=1 Tax=Flavobacterium suaedae TaxID=1767027 RepID=A0ABQ1JSY7_9FLAO|nr:mitoguardin [Flavobacterium suaedae]GGB73963.1 hypothetical protein GCM10007424_12320 [Flavobacterium suaedae]